MRKNDSKTIYRIETERAFYAVTLDRLKNTTAGQPRYNATIILINWKNRNDTPAALYFAPNYTFKGHYFGDEGEARWIVSEYEKAL